MFRSVLPIHSVLSLCTDCNKHHPRCSSTTQHIVISMENYQKLPSSILSIKNRCTKHGKCDLEILSRLVLPISLILKLERWQSLFVITWHPRWDTFQDISWFLIGSRVISMENYQKLPSSTLSIKNRCTKHGKQYELYCSIHGDPCCVMCIRNDHRYCQELRPSYSRYTGNHHIPDTRWPPI
jgi:hypothetical protein